MARLRDGDAIHAVADVAHTLFELSNAFADCAANLRDALASEQHEANQQEHQQLFRAQLEHGFSSLLASISRIVASRPPIGSRLAQSLSFLDGLPSIQGAAFHSETRPDGRCSVTLGRFR